jgi:hypothetical protein
MSFRETILLGYLEDSVNFFTVLNMHAFISAINIAEKYFFRKVNKYTIDDWIVLV